MEILRSKPASLKNTVVGSKNLPFEFFSVPSCSKLTNLPPPEVLPDQLEESLSASYEENQRHLKLFEERFFQIQHELVSLKSRFSKGNHEIQHILKGLEESLLQMQDEIESLKLRFFNRKLETSLKLGTSEENQDNQLKLGISEDKQGIQQSLPELKVFEKEMRDSVSSIVNDKWAGSHPAAYCEPVVDIVSVTLRKENASSSHMHSSNKSWELYGKIYVHDDGKVESGVDYCFYDRCLEDDDFDIIPFSGGSLSLRDPDYDIPMTMDEPTIKIDIRDKNTGEAIFDGSGLLVKEPSTITPDHFQQIQTTTVWCNDWSAEVKHVELMFGVFANVDVELRGKHRSKEEVKVYGSITAKYRLFGSGPSVDSITLFKKDSDAFECMTLGSSIPLTRSVFACPAYSPLEIHVELLDYTTKQLILQGCCVLQVSGYSDSKILCDSNFFNAQVSSKWERPYMLKKSCANAPSLNNWINKRFQPNQPKISAKKIVEVFSLSIVRQKDEQLRLSGMINFFNREGYHNLFWRDKNNPFVLPSGCNILPLEGPSYALQPLHHFSVSVDLVDTEKDVSIKGIVESHYHLDQRLESWYNRLLSCVIKVEDERSFAVLHYTVFSHAFMALLKVHFSIKGEEVPHVINGSLVACYRGDECKTEYERSFHRIVLFERHAQNPLYIPSKEFDLKLLRYAVAVPYNSALKIMVDLTCLSSGVSSCLCRTLEIEPGMDKVGLKEDEFGEISIDVKWGAASEGDWY